MGWNLYKGLELCKPVMGDKKGRGKVLLSVAVGWEPSWGWRGGPRKAGIMSMPINKANNYIFLTQ